jgi:pimeloyl-ACP methyl ester carboxylesterase
VVAYDRLGFGRSDARHGPLSAAFVREEAELWFPLVRARLGFDAFVALGHSVGGGMAALCAATWPETCVALVTESAQAFVEDRTLEGIRAAQAAFRDPAQLDRLRRYHGDKAGWVLDAWTETWFSPEFRSWSLAADLPRITCPTLVIHGDRDEYGSVEHPRRIGALVAGRSEVEILPGCRHVPHKEAEQLIVERVARFLETATR